jgi:hypothetical protein
MFKHILSQKKSRLETSGIALFCGLTVVFRTGISKEQQLPENELLTRSGDSCRRMSVG